MPTLFVNSHTKIGKGALFVHAFATIINAKSIGDNFRISHCCTIGNGNTGKPIIGNNVVIHPGCVIFGDIIIGDNVVIGAATLVNKNVPSNCVVVGNPAIVVKNNGVRVRAYL